jgi:nucleotide-binding universal stress UspA family protein
MAEHNRLIVCGVDGSAAADRALAWALEEAKRRGCVVRVVSAWMWDGMEAMGVPASAEEARELAEQRQHAALEKALVSFGGPPEVERVLARGRPSEVLTAAAVGAEMLVLGSHGHGSVHDKLVGSTSERAIRHAPCPVVVLPDPRHVAREVRNAGKRQRTPIHPNP